VSESVDPSKDYFRAVAACDVHAASDLVLQLLDEGMPMGRIISEILAPAQVRVGQMWESGRWSVADEHVATSITEGALSALTYAGTPRRGAHTRHVAMACAEGEWHSLPARMAAAVAGATGEVRVTMLGPSLPAEQLHRRLSAGDVDVLALSCTMPTNLVGAARCIAAAHDLDIPVMVGGRAFGNGPRRAVAIGADGWAADADALLGVPPELTGRSPVIPPEVLWLHPADEAIVTSAYDQLIDALPRLSRMTAYQHDRTREDIGWMVRHTAAAVLTQDVSIVEDLLTWLCDLLRGRVSASAIATSALLLADTIEHQAPAGADILRLASAQVQLGSLELDGRAVD
jgi:methanogenic corrinoid protein MtbC1